MPVERCPGQIPDAARPPDAPLDLRGGLDTDRDGRGDTVLTVEGADLLVYSDLDGDGFADRVLRIGPDGTVRIDDGAAADAAPDLLRYDPDLDSAG